MNVKDLDVDLLVGGALKYLLGSTGLAWLYVRKDLLSSLFPTSGGWFTQANIFAMDIYHHSPAPSARRFEAGTPAVPNLYAGIAGLQIIREVGLPAIAAQIPRSPTPSRAWPCAAAFASPPPPTRLATVPLSPSVRTG